MNTNKIQWVERDEGHVGQDKNGVIFGICVPTENADGKDIFYPVVVCRNGLTDRTPYNDNHKTLTYVQAFLEATCLEQGYVRYL